MNYIVKNLLLVVLMVPPVLIAGEENSQKEYVAFKQALLLQESGDVKYIKKCIEKHPDFRNYDDEGSLFDVFGKALANDHCDREVYLDLIKECLRQPGWDLLAELFTWKKKEAPDHKQLTVMAAANLLAKQRLDEASVKALQEAVSQAWDEILNDALTAVEKGDAKKLGRLVDYWPTLLTPHDYPTSRTTLLHRAAELFKSKKPQSVTIFALLMKRGASYTVKNDAGKSVKKLITPKHKAFEAFKYQKNLREAPPLISKKKIRKKISQVKPYWKPIAGGIAAIVLYNLIMRSSDDVKTNLYSKPVIEPLE